MPVQTYQYSLNVLGGTTHDSDYVHLAHQFFASSQEGGAEEAYGAAVVVVVMGGWMVGWNTVAAFEEKTAILVVDHTDFEQQEPAVMELALLGEYMAAHILQWPEADKV